jgi:rRNA maturation endonuclease Nob1
VGAVAEGAGFFEILCRGPSKCGTFVSVRPLDACPKCGSPKVARRAAEPPSKTKT